MSELEITYAAHTSTCTFLLDGDGICRRIVMNDSSKRASSSKRQAGRSAARCVGAQYVASLDPAIAGMLTDLPRVGAAMLFARVDERGRVSLVRTGTVTSFERHRSEDPFADRVPSVSVETSAPVLTPKTPTEPTRSRDVRDPYDDDDDDSARTQPIQALGAQAFRRLRSQKSGGPSATHIVEGVEAVDDDTLSTAEYESTKHLGGDEGDTGESPAAAYSFSPASASGPTTIRQAPRFAATPGGEAEAPVRSRADTRRGDPSAAGPMVHRLRHDRPNGAASHALEPRTERVASRGRRDR